MGQTGPPGPSAHAGMATYENNNNALRNWRRYGSKTPQQGRREGTPMRSLVTRQHGLDDPPPQRYQKMRDTKIPGSETDPRSNGRRTQAVGSRPQLVTT